MPTDLELIEQFVNMSADAKEVLNKLVDFVNTNGSVTWNLSGGVSITADSLPKMIADFNSEISDSFLDFETNFGGVYNSAITRDPTTGQITSGVITYASGHYLTITYNRSTTTGLLLTIDWTLKDAGAVTLAFGTKTLTRNTAGQLTSIA